MRYAILLVLDEESQHKISNVRTYLSSSGVSDDKFKLNHITIAIFDASNVDRLIETTEKFVANQKPFSLELASVGTFMTPSNIIYFAPVMTKELLKANDDFFNLITPDFIAIDRYYTPDFWVPHCTLASNTTDTEMIKAFELLKQKNILPLKVVVNKLCILQIDPIPYKRIAEYVL